MIIPVILIWGCWRKNAIVWDATCLLLASMLWNAALKTIFNIPLPAELGIDGLAFPSGHMQSSVVFYGWIALKTPHRWLQVMIGLGLVGIGQSLVHFGYHRYVDIAGAVFFGTMILIGHQFVQKIQKSNIQQNNFIILGGFSALAYLFNLAFSSKKLWTTIVFAILGGILWYKNQNTH